MNQDPSNIREAIFYNLFRENGIAASRTTYVNVQMNGEDLGLYLAVEAVDGRFTKSRFSGADDGGDGNLYKSIWPSSTDEFWYLPWLKTNKEEPRNFKITRFVEELNAIEQSSFVNLMERWTHVDDWIKYMSIVRLIEQWDGIFTFRCWTQSDCNNNNYFIYEGDQTDRLTIIPWDFDNTMVGFGRQLEDLVDHWTEQNPECTPVIYNSGGSTVRSPTCDPFFRYLGAEMWQEYASASRELLVGDLSEASFNQKVDEVSAQIDEEMSKTDAYQNWQNEVAALKILAGEKRDKIILELENN